MLWRNGCDGKVLRCGAGNRHRQSERQKYVVRKGFPVSPLILPLILQVEKEITKRDDADGVWTEKDRQGGRKTTNQEPNDETKL
jgi:hypothetical protein